MFFVEDMLAVARARQSNRISIIVSAASFQIIFFTNLTAIMTTARKISIYCLFSWLALVIQYHPCCAQTELDPGKWVKELADKDPKKNEAAKRLSEVLYNTDNVKV